MSTDEQATLHHPHGRGDEDALPPPELKDERAGAGRKPARTLAVAALLLLAVSGALLWYFGVIPGIVEETAGGLPVFAALTVGVRKKRADGARARDGGAGGQDPGRAALYQMTERRFELTGMPLATLLTVMYIAVLACAGELIRSFVLVPSAWEVAAASGALAALAVRLGLWQRRPGKAEPTWVAAARARQEEDLGRLTDGTRQAVEVALRRVAAVTGQEAYLYVAWCSQEGTHYGLCHAGASVPQRGRAVIMIGEHLLGDEGGLLALPVMAHEAQHFTGWRYWSFSLLTMAGSLGMIVAGWAVPWPLVLAPVVAVRLLGTALSWAVEAGCDVGGARATSPGATVAMLQYKAEARRAGRASLPRRERVAAVLAAATGTVHPPMRIRRWAVRALAA